MVSRTEVNCKQVNEGQLFGLKANSLRCDFRFFEFWFFYGVEFSMMKLYSLAVNNRTVCEVSVETPQWMPVKPRVPKSWLRMLAAQALREFFIRPPYLGCDTRTGSPILN